MAWNIDEWFSPGGQMLLQRFQKLRSRTLEAIEPAVRARAASAVSEAFGPGGALAQQPQDGLRELALGFGPPARLGPVAPGRAQLPERERVRLGGEAARGFAEAVPTPEQRQQVSALARELDTRGIAPVQFRQLVRRAREGDESAIGVVEDVAGRIPGAEMPGVPQPRPITGVREIGRPSFPERAGFAPAVAGEPGVGRQAVGVLGAAARVPLRFAEEEVELARPVTEPVGRFLGREAVEAVTPGVPRPLRMLGVPDVPGRERAIEAGERVGEVVGPEALVLSNLVPIPIIDPAIARLLRGAWKGGQMVTHAVLRRFQREAAELAVREGVEAGTRQAARQAADQAEQTLQVVPRETGVRVPLVEARAAAEVPQAAPAAPPPPVAETLDQRLEDMQELVRIADESLASRALTGQARLAGRQARAEHAAEAQVLQSIADQRVAGAPDAQILARFREEIDPTVPGSLAEEAMASGRVGRPQGLRQQNATFERTARLGVMERMLQEGALPPRAGGLPTSVDAADVVPPRGELTVEQRPVRLGGASDQFVGQMRDIRQVMDEVVTSENPVLRAIVGKTGINPSYLQTTPMGRAVVAYQRQRVAANEIAELAVTVAQDVHREAVTGRTVNFRVPQVGKKKGLIQNVSGLEGASLRWQDVFSRPDRYSLNVAQRAEIDDFLRVAQEVEFNRVQAGLKPLAKLAPGEVTEAGFYVPRQVEGIRGVELQRPSSPHLQRRYEEAADGAARGIDYSADSRATLELHVRMGNKEIADKQFSDLLEELNAEAMQRGERIFVTPKELLPEPVLKRMSNATLNRMSAERELRRLRAQRLRLQTGGRFRGPEARAQRVVRAARAPERKVTQQAIQDAETVLSQRMAEYNTAKGQYSKALEAARRAETAPGNLFGDAQDTIGIAEWRNRFFRREDAESLRDGIDRFFELNKQSPWVRGPMVLGNYIRFLASVGDFAEPFIQGQLVFAADPPSWARSALRHYQAFFDPTVQGRLMRDYLSEFQEMAAHGTPVGDPEFFAALRQEGGAPLGRLLELLPKGDEARQLARLAGRQTFGRFQASYNVGLGSSRAMLTRVLKDTISDAAERQAFIRNATGGLDSRALGVGPGQRAFEGFALAFSPRFLRSTLAMIGDLRRGLRDPRGRAAWTSLATLSSAVTGLYVLSGLGLGKSWDEIKDGLNPLNGKKFLSHEVNRDWIGIGGQVRAIVQIMAYTGANWNRPGAFLELDQFENPLIRAYMSRGAPALNILGGAAEALTAAEVLPFDRVETPVDFVKHIGTSALPFVLQGLMEGEQAMTAAAGLVGGRTSAETPWERFRTAYRQETGLDYEGTEAGRAVAEQDPRLRALLAEAERLSAARGFRPAIERAERGEILASQTEGLSIAAEGVRRGESGAGEQFARQYSDWKHTAFALSLRDTFGEDFPDPTTDLGRAVSAYHEVEMTYDETGAPEYTIFYDERDARIEDIRRLEPNVAKALEQRLQLPEEFRDVEEQFVPADNLRDQLRDIPEVVGLTAEQHQEVKDFLRQVNRLREERFREDIARDPRVNTRPDLEKAISLVARNPEAFGVDVPDWSSGKLEAWAVALKDGIPDELRTRGYIDFLGEHRAELEMFYPDLYRRAGLLRELALAE